MKNLIQPHAEPHNGAIKDAFDALDNALVELDIALDVLRDRIEPVLRAEEPSPPSVPQVKGQTSLSTVSRIAETINGFTQRVHIQISAVLSRANRVDL